MNTTRKLALSGLFTALSFVLLFLSNLVPTGMYSFPAAAGVVVWLLSFFAGTRYAVYSYAVVSVLAFLFCIDKEAPLCFFLFLGYYPLVRKGLERLRLKVLSWLLKLLLFNAAAVGTYFLLIFLFSVPQEEFRLFGLSLPLLLLLLLNGVFVLYDLALRLFEKRYRDTINKFVTNFLRKN